jgi:cytoskeletal protein CcmA (bactofilin family)
MNATDDRSPPGQPAASSPGGELGDGARPDAIEVVIGRALPPAMARDLPTLAPQRPPDPGEGRAPACSVVAAGMRFTGRAVLSGPCRISGEVEGSLSQAPDGRASVIVTETGWVQGDIQAHKISVMGRANGTLDASEGDVWLYDTANVRGRVRYGRLRVSGADLDAVFEKAVTGPSS